MTEIEGTLKSGEQVEFSRSSGKILLTNSFSVEGESTTEFVFDLAVGQTSDGYVLLPNPAESGTNVPFVDNEQEGENLHLRFIGELTLLARPFEEIGPIRWKPASERRLGKLGKCEICNTLVNLPSKPFNVRIIRETPS